MHRLRFMGLRCSTPIPFPSLKPLQLQGGAGHSLAYGSGAHAILKTVLRFADTPERANCGPLSPDRSNLASTAWRSATVLHTRPRWSVLRGPELQSVFTIRHSVMIYRA